MGQGGTFIISENASVNAGSGQYTNAINSVSGTVRVLGGSIISNYCALSQANVSSYSGSAYLLISGGTLRSSTSSQATVRLFDGSALISGGTISNSSGGYGIEKDTSVTCTITGGNISSKNF